MANLKTNCVSFLILLSLQHLFILHVTSFTPIDNFAINCGSSKSETSLDNRNWTSDIDSKVLSTIEPQNHHPSVTASVPELPPSIATVPYSNARLSRSEFNYSFPVTGGQKFVRLYFYPAPYPSFNRYNSLFSVKAGHYTLLKDFNASLHADNEDDPKETLSREYCINVEPGHRLNITFTPSSTTRPEAYAFVNGIEVVSMPKDLYYGKQFKLADENSALETVYRINVGGNKISTEHDNGMFRYWDDDVRYLVTQQQSTSAVAAGPGLMAIYEDARFNYSAPKQVYLSARTYERTKTNENTKKNATWEFEVDSKFAYMIRLHFCEFEQHVQNVGDRVFQIFIADTLVEPHADVIQWRGGKNLVPVYKDYAVPMLKNKGTSNSKKLNFSVKLQSHPNQSESWNHDVILNGIEIFKVSDKTSNLGSGSNPSPPSTSTKTPSKTSKKNTTIPIVASVAATISFFVLCVIGFLIFRCLTRAAAKDANPSPSSMCRHFTISEIRAATDNFDDSLIVGNGGFGNVYKGHIVDKFQTAQTVAIKRLKPGSDQGEHEFQTEIKMLSQFRHPHLASLIGYCNDGGEMILVYDFMARGTLRDHLYGSNHHPLSWNQRLDICLAAARGLHFLHAGENKQSVIHRDVKSTNILLDEDWVAKVSDFGLSKVGPNGSHVTTDVKGSFGYLDPEYYMSQWLTQKSDVYSFGVVLLEVLCGRPPIKRRVDKQEESLVAWVERCYHEGRVHQTVDPALRGTIKPRCLKKFVEIALSCLDDHGKQRPLMGDVVNGLERALKLQQSSNRGGALVQEKGKSEEMAMSLTKIVGHGEEFEEKFRSVNESSSSKATTTCSEEEQALVHGVFSELGNPTAR